jgi:hypothetical protein
MAKGGTAQRNEQHTLSHHDIKPGGSDCAGFGAAFGSALDEPPASSFAGTFTSFSALFAGAGLSAHLAPHLVQKRAFGFSGLEHA